MATQVDPFVIPIPKEFLKNREMKAFFEYQNRFLHDLWVRTGGGTDLIDESQIGELYEPGIQTSNVDELTEELEVDSEIFFRQQVKTKDLEIIELLSSDTAITSTGDEFIVCNNTADAIVTLNVNPEDGEDCIVARKDGRLTILGDINGKTSVTISGKKSSIHFKYTIIAGEWTAT